VVARSYWISITQIRTKNHGVESRARTSGRRIIKRAEKKLASVLKQFPDGAVEKAIDVLAGQLKATKQMWDVNAKKMVKIPDEKIRQDAALAILAYEWGTPVQRSISAQRLRGSPNTSRGDEAIAGCPGVFTKDSGGGKKSGRNSRIRQGKKAGTWADQVLPKMARIPLDGGLVT
jgi:hypothetical protein